MPDITYIGEYSLTNEHAVAATDVILAHILTLKDNAGRKLLKSAERLKYTAATLNRPDTPYALLRILDPRPRSIQEEFVIDAVTAEVVIDLVFQANPNDDVQALGNKFSWHIWRGLQCYHATENPTGLDLGEPTPDAPRWWNFSSDTDFKAKIKRSVEPLDGPTEDLTGSRYAIAISFKIDLYPTVPIT